MKNTHSHIEILKTLIKLFQFTEQFSTSEACPLNIHRLRTLRVLEDLERYGVLTRMPFAYKRRHWAFTSSFPINTKSLIALYEMNKITRKRLERVKRK